MIGSSFRQGLQNSVTLVLVPRAYLGGVLERGGS